MYPAVLREFQSQMWLRISETSRIAHRSREEDFSAKRFQKQDDKMKLEKALKLLGGARDTSSLVASRRRARAMVTHSLHRAVAKTRPTILTTYTCDGINAPDIHTTSLIPRLLSHTTRDS